MPFGSGFPKEFESGIPGIGVAPLLFVMLTFAGSGIPGVGVPFAGKGVVEKPGGKFAGSTVWKTFVLAFVFGVSADWQARLAAVKKHKNKSEIFFSIITICRSLFPKIAVPV